ncbi:hypothetical protein O3G_MSEX015072 [Manduca sexta]|uniref:Uncharacterized protein n=1 Tax=Manduca sexta TaxID=7130 RepID=A0A921ZXF1_MANSE|nr:hypothetical protein O3G_MSEX015072 [Manduca sexta]KAG6465315.1 hypothetical protein O3G_MSEX015072 [Manduca sexta]
MKFTTVFLIVLVAMSALAAVTEAVRVPPCDEVCNRIPRERDECCRAHGHSGYSSCSGGMYCY